MMATCASAESAGWQQTNIIRNWSSLIVLVFTISFTIGDNVYSDCSNGVMDLAYFECSCCFRNISTALFLAAVNSHAEGLSGSPFIFQVLSAFSKVSCTTSSASCKFWGPNNLVSTVTSLPHSCLKRWSIACSICNKEFNSFYQNVSILGEDNLDKKVFRVQLSNSVSDVIKNAFGLLGISVPERM